MNKRERVARAFWVESERMDRLPFEQRPGKQDFIRILADIAVTALEPVTVQEAARVANLAAALRWYEKRLSDFSTATDGSAEIAERDLDQDGGKRARAALAEQDDK